MSGSDTSLLSSIRAARRWWTVRSPEQAGGHIESAEIGIEPREEPEIDGRRFLIVTPAFNAEAFIDEAIASVLRQGVPGYSLHYHVQDGGSTDGTLERLRAWERRLNDGSHRPADDVRFSFASERDGGMYDALRRGFDRLAPRDDDILTWINSDDALAQGSLVTVSGAFGDVAGCEFLSGRVALLNEAGAIIVLASAIPYARGALADGLHDGRTLPFLMQEGTFFSGRVWNAVGGVDTAFRLAGDWDLWRRMARVANHCIVDSVTGYHRRRRGQLSSDMVTYYNEVDAAPRLPAAGFGSLGTVVTFDQASARWIETAYDPATLMPPVLLRDGRPELSAACRPVAGFAAPEGPYPQYGLPGGIRWMEGSRAEIAMQVPAAGRYRVRLTLRASRDDVVVGIGIGKREPQPITLEPPVPLVDQVVETVRWLDAGESRLVVACDGLPEARSLLLVRCEVTSTDEAFSRRPILAPLRSAPPHRPHFAIVIVCSDDEPDLLDLSLVGCEQAVLAGTAVFVVRDPASAALERVLRFREALVTGCIDSAGSPVDTEAVRRRLHAEGHAEVLIVPRGALVVPRGIDAASALLDATGAGVASGLIDERNSMGRSLHLSSGTGAAPVLSRALAAISDTVHVGCALVQTVASADENLGAPVVWVLDGDRPMLGRTPASLLAAGLALLGYDVRHVVVDPGKMRVPPPGALIICSAGLADHSAATMTIVRDGGTLRLLQDGGETIDLPLAVDTDLLVPRDRDEARRRLGFWPEERIVCIAETTVEATAAARATARAHGPVRILDFGPVASSALPRDEDRSFGAIADPLLLSYLLSAADAALVLEPGGGPLACAAWACDLPVLDRNGTVVRLGGDPRGLVAGAADEGRSRDLIVATRSLAALAGAIDTLCPDLAAVGGSSPRRLRGGTIQVRSYRDTDRPGWFDRIDGCGTVTMVGSATPFAAADEAEGLSIGGLDAEIIVCLKRAAVSRLRLLVRGRPGETWTIHAGGGAATFRLGEDGEEMAIVSGAYEPGPTRVRFQRHGDDIATAPLLHIVGLSAGGEPVLATPDWEETRFELVPASEWPTPVLEADGEWQRVAGFLPSEPAVTREGLFTRFRWSEGSSCVIRVRAAADGTRLLRLALSAGIRHQRVRPVVAGRAYEWCVPLAGPIGHIEHREWMVEWPAGDIDVTLELNDVLRPPGQELGIILFAVALKPLSAGTARNRLPL